MHSREKGKRHALTEGSMSVCVRCASREITSFFAILFMWLTVNEETGGEEEGEKRQGDKEEGKVVGVLVDRLGSFLHLRCDDPIELKVNLEKNMSSVLIYFLIYCAWKEVVCITHPYSDSWRGLPLPHQLQHQVVNSRRSESC